MKWWARSPPAHQDLPGFLVADLAVLLATLGFTQVVVQREVERTLNRELLTTGEVFDGAPEGARARASRRTPSCWRATSR